MTWFLNILKSFWQYSGNKTTVAISSHCKSTSARHHGIVGVAGSIPVGSTIQFTGCFARFSPFLLGEAAPYHTA